MVLLEKGNKYCLVHNYKKDCDCGEDFIMGDLLIKENKIVCKECNSSMYTKKCCFIATYKGEQKFVEAFECKECGRDIFIVHKEKNRG